MKTGGTSGMCGRLNLIDAPMYAFFAKYLNLPLQIDTAFNVTPTESVWALTLNQGVFEATTMRWWLVPNWSQGPQHKFSMFNARAETIKTSKAYAQPYKRQRCVIPVSGYFEWRDVDGRRQPFKISRDDGEVLLFGGLWDQWHGSEGTIISCTIVTTEAPASMQPFHHRAPLMLDDTELTEWLDVRSTGDALDRLLAPSVPYALSIQDVDAKVNYARNKSESAQHAVGDASHIPVLTRPR